MARCIGSVGLYVPGGTAVLPSTALMLAVVWEVFFLSDAIFGFLVSLKFLMILGETTC